MKSPRLPYLRPGRVGYHADFLSYQPWGGKRREPLIPEGGRHAVTDYAQAVMLFSKRLQELEDYRTGRRVESQAAATIPTLGAFLDRHFALKAGKVRPYSIKRDRARLERLVAKWRDPRLDLITTTLVNDVVLAMEKEGRAAQSIHHVLNSLSSLLQNALREGHVKVNTARLAKRPTIRRDRALWLEADEGYRLLRGARDCDNNAHFRGQRGMEPLVATALLTGGRESELFALLVEDIDFDNGLVLFRPNSYYPERKSRHAIRNVPLWPQLRDMLVQFIGSRRSGLLFRRRNGEPLRGVYGSLRRVFESARIPLPPGKAWHLFRHTYTAMRLQTLDNGAPVSIWTVARELGHGSLKLVEDTYGHVLKVRHRSAVIEYRPKILDLAGTA